MSFSNPAVREFSNACSIREKNIFLAICKFYSFDATLFNTLYGSIREDAFFFTIRENAFNSSIRETKGKISLKSITYIISLVLSGKCFSIWLFENLKT